MSVASYGLSDHETPRCNGRLLECRTYTIDEVATLLGIGRNAAYEGARRGAFPTIKIGKSVRAPKALIDRMLGIGGEAA
jgi:excisionase family DNA binding protein